MGWTNQWNGYRMHYRLESEKKTVNLWILIYLRVYVLTSPLFLSVYAKKSSFFLSLLLNTVRDLEICVFWAKTNQCTVRPRTERFLGPVQKNFLYSAGFTKFVQLRGFYLYCVVRFVQFESFWTQLISVHLRGPFSLRSFSSRPYCSSKIVYLEVIWKTLKNRGISVYLWDFVPKIDEISLGLRKITKSVWFLAKFKTVFKISEIKNWSRLCV